MHRARRLLILSCCILVFLAGPPTGARSRAVDFLVPGISLESVSLTPGARVSYLVITLSFGAVDSSYVELRVLDRAKGEVRLEVVSSPYPRKAAESVTVRLRLLERVTAISSPSEFPPCLREMLIREGTEPFRAATAKERDEFDVEALFLPSGEGTERTALESSSISTPAGIFRCEGVRISKRASRILDLGGIRTERIEEESSTVRLSPTIPFWGLVRATVEKRSLTKSSLARPGSSSPRVTRTESILLSYKKPRGRS
jgi:hypothetical protein